MAEKRPEAAEDSSDSDDSMEGGPNFSVEESELPENLLLNSNEFVGRYEEHQPELQEIIDQLRKNTEEFVDQYGKATETSRKGKITAAAGTGVALAATGSGFASAASGGGLLLAATGAGFTLAPLTGGTSLALAGGLVFVAGVVANYRGERNKGAEEKKIQEEVGKALQKFNTTVNTVTKHLNNICNDVEKILQHQDDEQSTLIESEAEELRKLAELLSAEDLRRLLEQGRRTLEKTQNISPEISALLLNFGFLFIFEDNRTLRDIEKLKEQFTVPEDQLESEMGRFICKMRETIGHLQETLDETTRSKTEVQRLLIPNLKEYFRLQRRTHSL